MEGLALGAGTFPLQRNESRTMSTDAGSPADVVEGTRLFSPIVSFSSVMYEILKRGNISQDLSKASPPSVLSIPFFTAP